MLDSIILGMVFNEEQTGYDIKKAIENGVGTFYRASFGSLYPALKKLAGKGLLHLSERAEGERQKKYYQATAAGQKAFSDWLLSPTDVMDGTNTHLAKVYFFDRLPAETRDRQLARYEDNNLRYLQKLRALERGFAGLAQPERHYYKLSTLCYGILITQQTIRWCRHIRAGEPLQQITEED